MLRGTVLVNDVPARKPSQTIIDSDVLLIADDAQNYVSRAALKLLHGLQHFHIVVEGRHTLDIGASTGGFTQVLLEQGAAHVTAIDVGHGQMAEIIAKDARVTSYENLNARDLTRDQVSEHVNLIVSDVSFISLKLALLPALSLMKTGAELLALIKPQFEVGKDHVGRGGLVTDRAQHIRVCEEISAFLVEQGWTVRGITPSPVEGGDGNTEFLIAAVKS